MDLFKARAKSLAGGLEPELSVAVDVMFPVETFIAAVAAFQRQFPTTLLKFEIESSAVVEPVLDERAPSVLRGRGRLYHRISLAKRCSRSGPSRLSHHSTRSRLTVDPFHRRSSTDTYVLYTSIRPISLRSMSAVEAPGSGIFRISGPNLPSCARVSGLAACPFTCSRRISQAGPWFRSRSRTVRPPAA